MKHRFYVTRFEVSPQGLTELVHIRSCADVVLGDITNREEVQAKAHGKQFVAIETVRSDNENMVGMERLRKLEAPLFWIDYMLDGTQLPPNSHRSARSVMEREMGLSNWWLAARETKAFEVVAPVGTLVAVRQ